MDKIVSGRWYGRLKNHVSIQDSQVRCLQWDKNDIGVLGLSSTDELPNLRTFYT